MAHDVDGRPGTLDARRRYQKAAELAESLSQPVEQLAALCRLLLNTIDPQTGDTVQMCVREQVVYRRFLPIVSDRIETRLVTSMKKILAQDTSERFEHATLNSIGAMVLVGLGIVSPELFELRGLSRDARSHLDSTFSELGMTSDAVKRLYAAQKQHGFCWHRWKTTTRKPGPLSDLMVRQFITEHLRRDREALLAAADYPNFFIRAKECAKALRAEKEAEHREDIVADMRILVMTMLGRDEVHDCVKRLAVQSWYRDLDAFFSGNKKPSR